MSEFSEREIYLIEDDVDWRKTLIPSLEEEEHYIEGIATSMEEAEMLLKKIEERETSLPRMLIFLLDGNLGYGPECEDGEENVAKIKKLSKQEGVTTIRISSNPRFERFCDEYVGKNIAMIIKTLKNSWQLG